MRLGRLVGGGMKFGQATVAYEQTGNFGFVCG